MDVLIRGKGVYKIYDMGLTKVEALSGVNFEIYSNEFLVILGPSGSGKSTFLNILGGMDTATKGEIYYKDMKLHDANRAKLTKYRKDAVGFVFQFYNLMPNLTAIENVDLAREISSSPLDAREMLDKVGLSDRADHFPSELSGGQQQRVGIARALAMQPKIIFADEPTGNLDTKTTAEVLELMKQIVKEEDQTLIMVTHDVDIAKVADRQIKIVDGKAV